jgi:hypothetical protein
MSPEGDPEIESKYVMSENKHYQHCNILLLLLQLYILFYSLNNSTN